MKRMNKFKIGVIGVALFALTSASQAQWATIDVTNVLYDYFRALREHALNSNVEAISNGQQLQMAQAAQNVTNADYRARLASVYNNILQDDERTRPTYAQCIEITKKQVGVASVATSLNGGRGSSGGGGRTSGTSPSASHFAPNKPTTIQENIRTQEDSKNMIIANIGAAKTCDPRYGSICSNTTGEYALADVSVFGLLSNSGAHAVNVSGSSVSKTSGQDIDNYSLDANGYLAGQQYINVATLSKAPSYPDPAKVKDHPGYIPLYNAMIIKLNAASEVLKSMLDLRRGTSLSSNAAASTSWTASTTKSDYAEIFPNLIQPQTPSFYEFLNFKVMADVFGSQTLLKASSASDSDTLKGIQSKIAMNNLIAWEQYNQQEKTNVLLSHILVQLSTPASKPELDNEYAKFSK